MPNKPTKSPPPTTPPAEIPTQSDQERKGDLFDPVPWFPLQNFAGMSLNEAVSADKLMAELKNCLVQAESEINGLRDECRHYRRTIWRRERSVRYYFNLMAVAQVRIEEYDRQALALKHAIEYRKQTLRLVVNGEIDPSKLQPRHEL